jgi:hypothetical protein
MLVSFMKRNFVVTFGVMIPEEVYAENWMNIPCGTC